MGIFGKPNIEKMKKKGDVMGLAKALKDAMEDNNKSVLVDVTRALGEIDDERATNLLFIMLPDKDKDVSNAAAEALTKKTMGLLGREVKPLGQALPIDIPKVRKDVRKALNKIRRESKG